MTLTAVAAQEIRARSSDNAGSPHAQALGIERLLHLETELGKPGEVSTNPSIPLGCRCRWQMPSLRLLTQNRLGRLPGETAFCAGSVSSSIAAFFFG